jgi:hypothetical protein
LRRGGMVMSLSSAVDRLCRMGSIESGWEKWFSYLVAAVMHAIGAVFLATAVLDLIPVEDPQTRPLLIGFLLIWNAFQILLTHHYLGFPTRISVHPDGSFDLHSPRRTLHLLAAQVRELDCDGDGDWYLRHERGKADLRFFRATQMAGFRQQLKAHNPAIAGSGEQR